MARLIYTGNVIVDLVLTIGDIPSPGGDTLATSSLITAGGGYNTMTAAVRDGTPVVFTGQYGTGMFGDVVRKALYEGGLEIVQDGIPDMDNGYCMALVDNSTERTFITHLGAEGELTRADMDKVEVRPDDLIYISGYSLAHPKNAQALASWVTDLPSSCRVLFDPSPLIAELDPAIFHTIMARTDVFSANARESYLGSGLSDPQHAAAWFRGQIRSGGMVVVRDGAAGCWLTGHTETGDVEHVPGFAVEAVDSNGAGDAHGGVLAGALLRTVHPLEAVRRANAAAALAVTKFGPATAPDTAQIDVFMAAALAADAVQPIRL
ncbi:PfkB family carbohydrate kinase [Arthrobacter sp. 35W]|uniref:PfkB family carbohydrate kinase n=1 Tax=Arthrobacter sp. 35W TaxID=1132441 RepID=UPI000401646B|nr:PfkB family carbohydrate kinase [Arthrobacter sp. 35W]